MSIFLYERVSHKNSAVSGISIDEQIRAGLDYAYTSIPDHKLFGKSFDSDIPGVYCDKAVSGWDRPFACRPAGIMIMRDIKPGDHVVFYSVDRAARNLRDFCNMTWEFERMGVYCHYITDQINSSTAVGRFQLHMKASAAQFFSDLISERTREALAIRRMQKGLAATPSYKSKTKWIATIDNPAPPTLPKIERPVGRILRYERVSHDLQYTSGLGLEQQSIANAAAAERLSKELGGTIDRVFVDPAVSAFSKKFSERPAGRELLEYAQPGDDIVIYRLDRAWRNPGDAIEMAQKLMDRNIYLHFVCEGIRTDTRQGAEWIAVLASMAHMESSMKSIRTKQALDACRRAGRPVGTMPIGWRGKKIGHNMKKLVLSPKELGRRCTVYLMKHALDMRPVDMDKAVLAMRCYRRRKPATLADMKQSKIWRALGVCEEFKAKLSESLWNSILDRSWRILNTPIPREYWYRPKWKGDAMSVVEFSRLHSLSSR
jgi:DNA invertase Pin-like site-specific DNA recombinase